jgi:putative oxidoreductase
LFLCHGAQKLLSAFGGTGAPGTTVPLLSLMGVAGTLELAGGALILLGLYTRPVAFVLAGEMAVAYFLKHVPQAFWPIDNHGELAVLYCFVFLLLAAHGAGACSADAAIGTRRRAI